MDVLEGELILHSESSPHTWRETAIDFTAGCVSGCCGIVVGQPFDTVKVRMQTSPPEHFHGAIHCVRETVAKEGASALFKGIVPPLASAAVINAITFGVWAQTNRWWELDAPRGPGEGLELRHHFFSGSMAGIVQALVVIPTDTVKVKLQVQVGHAGSSELRYKGSLDCCRQILATEGLAGLFRGSYTTVLRETPSYGLYFASYEGIKAAAKERLHASKEFAAFLAGGLAGTASWVCIYPLDVIKSIQQSSAVYDGVNTASMVDVARAIYRRGGVRAFFRGVGTTIARAFPVNAVIFPVYEATAALLRDKSSAERTGVS